MRTIIPELEVAPDIPGTEVATAACVLDPGPFTAEDGVRADHAQVNEAAAVCARCPGVIADQCPAKVAFVPIARQPAAARSRAREAVLAHLREHGPSIAADIVTASGIPQTTIQKAVDRLRKAGLITAERVTGPGAGCGRPTLLTLANTITEEPQDRTGKRQR
ncbi:helix-turn-helix transcriptional regulator [Streptoverticillium reticulum]|uniref:helix-turn-helix transcriptional regulator n=1 Tax=Streptoverticillium reticulum TaxID=1433415 RepID=UPI0039BF9E93